MILYNHFHADFRKQKFKSFPVLHFYDLKDIQEPEMRRQITDPPFLFSGKDNLISMRTGKNCIAQHGRKPFTCSSPAPHGRTFHAPAAQHRAFQRGQQQQHSTAAMSLPPHTGDHSLLTRKKRASAAHKMWTGDGLTGIPLADKASWLHPFDRPSFSAYHAKSKYPSVNWRTCSISDLIVLNIASSLQINGNIKSRSNGIPQSLWSS